MTDFKVGDEVVCVSLGVHPDYSLLKVGQTYTVDFVYPPDDAYGELGLELSGVRCDPELTSDNNGLWLVIGWSAHHFRKVQRRDISAWLKTSVGNTDRLDKRKKVRA